MSPTRAAFLEWCHAQLGAPYRWGGKGAAVWTPRGLIVSDWADESGLSILAYDCSGFVTTGLHDIGGPDWRAGKGADELANTLPRVDVPQPGDVVCYGPPGQTTHVMVVTEGGRVIGACGGDHTTTTLEQAVKQAAKVKIRPSIDYRPDRKWVVSLPLADGGSA
jgi:cell wall-associated NlpC family hydrolase